VTEPGLHPVARAKAGPLSLAAATLSSRPRAFLRYDTAEAREELHRLLVDFRPDIVHFDSIGTMALLEVVLASPNRPRIVAHTHDAVSQLYKTHLQEGSALQRALSWVEYCKYSSYEQRDLRQADVIIVDSEEDAEHLSGATGGRCVVTLPLGVNLQTFCKDGNKVKLEKPALVFSGSMIVQQSADAAIFLVKEVMPRVWEQHPGCHLYLVGNRPLPVVQALASDRVHVTGFVEDLAAYLRAASVYVCPLRIGSGMRTRVVEALACGAPTVATLTALRGLAEPINSVGKPWVVAESAEEFAKEVDSILSGRNPDLSWRASSYAQQNYSWDVVARSLLEIYARLGVPS
jgi:glycosyltransferase involved in cell wall biosynthesis